MDKNSILLGVELFNTKTAGIKKLSETVKGFGGKAYLTNDDEHSQIVIAPFTSEIAGAIDDLIDELGGFGEADEDDASFKPVIYNTADQQAYSVPAMVKDYQMSFDDAEINANGKVALVEINDTFVDYILDNQQTVQNEIKRVINKYYQYLESPEPTKPVTDNQVPEKPTEPDPVTSQAPKQVTLPTGEKFSINPDLLFPDSQDDGKKESVVNRKPSSEKVEAPLVEDGNKVETTANLSDEDLAKQSKSLEIATVRFNDLVNYQVPKFEDLALRELQPDVVETQEHIASFRREAIYQIAIKLNQLRVEAKKNAEAPVAKSKSDTQKNQKVIDDNLATSIEKLRDQKQQEYVANRNKYVESLRPALESAYDEKNRATHNQAVMTAEQELEAKAAKHKESLKAAHENYAKSAFEKADEIAFSNLSAEFVKGIMDKFEKQVDKEYADLQDKAMDFQGNVELATATDKDTIEHLKQEVQTKDADLADYKARAQTVHEATSELQAQIDDLQQQKDQLSQSLTQRNQEIAAERQNVTELIRTNPGIGQNPLMMAASTNNAAAQTPQSEQPTNRKRPSYWGWLVGLGSVLVVIVMVAVVGFSLYHVGASKAAVASVQNEAMASSLSASYALASSKQSYESSVSYASQQSSEAAESAAKASSEKEAGTTNIKKGDKFNYRTNDGKMVLATADSDHSGTYEINGKTYHFNFSQSK